MITKIQQYKRVFENAEIPKPFFIEATNDTIDGLLIKAGIYGGDKLHAPYVGVSKDGTLWEMFMHKEGIKSGWMIHPTNKKIKADYISKYIKEGINRDYSQIKDGTYTISDRRQII